LYYFQYVLLEDYAKHINFEYAKIFINKQYSILVILSLCPLYVTSIKLYTINMN